jgi:hypothetical protein
MVLESHLAGKNEEVDEEDEVEKILRGLLLLMKTC